jgi:hypothetical protein
VHQLSAEQGRPVTAPARPDRAAANATSRPVSTYPKQALVVIHGIGEQRPMDTLRNFVWAMTGMTAPPHVVALREALDLAGQRGL